MKFADEDTELETAEVVVNRRKKNAANIEYEMSLEEVAAELGVSREMVFKIEQSGLRKIRAFLGVAEHEENWRDRIASS